MSTLQSTTTFGRLKTPHTIIVTRGDDVRQYTVRPWALGALVGVSLLVGSGMIASAGYLLLNDDLMAVAVSRQESLRQAYEDRIATLRAQLDHATSRQMLTRDMVRTKVDALLDQQEEIAQRFEQLAPMFDKARENGLIEDGAAAAPTPDAKPRPQRTGDASDALGEARSALAAMAYLPEQSSAAARFGMADEASGALAAIHRVSAPAPAPAQLASLRVRPGKLDITEQERGSIPTLVAEVEAAVRTARDEQLSQAEKLAGDARRRSKAIADSLRLAGIDVTDAEPVLAQGGPFEPVPQDFDGTVARLDEALTTLERVSEKAATLPLARPVRQGVRSSGYGVRRDPFLGTAALHAGIDFVAPVGTSIRATAPGKVVEAGTNGGYGRMVEIDHGNGLRTRYAHMSTIAVSAGQRVEAGAVVGYVGSTGRSTGPHLHYEIRRDGAAVNPDRFLTAGRAIGRLG